MGVLVSTSDANYEVLEGPRGARFDLEVWSRLSFGAINMHWLD
jgi:hypothetical protein